MFKSLEYAPNVVSLKNPDSMTSGVLRLFFRSIGSQTLSASFPNVGLVDGCAGATDITALTTTTIVVTAFATTSTTTITAAVPILIANTIASTTAITISICVTTIFTISITATSNTTTTTTLSFE